MYHLSGALPLPYVPGRVISGALVDHRHSFAPPRCRTSQYRRAFVPLSVSLWNDLISPVFDGVGMAGFKNPPFKNPGFKNPPLWEWRVSNAFLLTFSFLSSTILSFSSFHGLIAWGCCLWTDRVFSPLPSLHNGLQLIILIIIIIIIIINHQNPISSA